VSLSDEDMAAIEARHGRDRGHRRAAAARPPQCDLPLAGWSRSWINAELLYLRKRKPIPTFHVFAAIADIAFSPGLGGTRLPTAALSRPNSVAVQSSSVFFQAWTWLAWIAATATLALNSGLCSSVYSTSLASDQTAVPRLDSLLACLSSFRGHLSPDPDVRCRSGECSRFP